MYDIGELCFLKQDIPLYGESSQIISVHGFTCLSASSLVLPVPHLVLR